MPVLRITMRMMKSIATKAEGRHLYRLLTWFSPGFPIGAFSYSHGLETAAAGGRVHDRETLQRWIAAILTHGTGRMDADTLRDAHGAASA
jgi:urease accessory protein